MESNIDLQKEETNKNQNNMNDEIYNYNDMIQKLQFENTKLDSKLRNQEVEFNITQEKLIELQEELSNLQFDNNKYNTDNDYKSKLIDQLSNIVNQQRWIINPN